MNPDPRPSSDRAPAPAINYFKLTLCLLAAIAFWQVVEHWDDFKAGYTAGYHAER